MPWQLAYLDICVRDGRSGCTRMALALKAETCFVFSIPVEICALAILRVARWGADALVALSLLALILLELTALPPRA